MVGDQMLNHQPRGQKLSLATRAELGFADHDVLQELLLVFSQPQDVLMAAQQVAFQPEAVAEAAVAEGAEEVSSASNFIGNLLIGVADDGCVNKMIVPRK